MDSYNHVIMVGLSDIEMRHRQVAQIEKLIADFNRSIDSLEAEIRAEEVRTGIHDPASFAYSTLAMADIQRRDNLRRSTSKLESQLIIAKDVLDRLSQQIANLQSQKLGSDQLDPPLRNRSLGFAL